MLTTQHINAQDYRNSIITDPGISRRCQVMTQKRDQKIKNKQKMRALINRSRRLLIAAPKNKKQARRKLQTILFRLRHEYNLNLSKIKRIEEGVVRQGCPGIKLE